MEPRPPIREALTFDDVLLVPGASEVLPGQVDTRTRLTKTVELYLVASGFRGSAAQ